MIIKSMSRKTPSFSQLIDYIEDSEKSKHASRRFSVFHNVFGHTSEALKKAFTDNASYLKARKDGAYLYHEIISIKRTHSLSEEAQKKILQKMVQEYLTLRAKNQLAYAVLHDDNPDSLHFHLVISANEYKGEQRKWFYKADFANIQTHLERHVLTHYPELNQQAVFYGNLTAEEKEAKQQKARLSQKGAELKRRTGKTPKRDEVKETLEAIFSHSTTPQDFTESMKQAGFTFYQRGKHAGIQDRDGNKYRFATLGLAEHWATFDEKMRASMSQHHTHTQSVPTNEQSSASSVQVRSETHQTNTEHCPRDTAIHSQETAPEQGFKEDLRHAETVHETRGDTFVNTPEQPSETQQNTQTSVEKPVFVEQIADTIESAKEELKNLSGFQVDEATRERRLEEMKARREYAKAQRQQHQTGKGHKPKQ